MSALPTREERAWAAGLFEGEGWVFVKVCVAPKDRKSRRFTLNVGITNTETMLLQPFLHWGGRIRPRCGTGLSKKPLYEWRLCSQQAARFLTAILPFMRGPKAEKAKVALRFQLQMRQRRGRSASGRFVVTPKEDLQWREQAQKAIRA